MLLYFLRHAEAEAAAASDFDRALTGKGCEQADKAGKFCARHGLQPDVVLTSPVTRAKQTAQAVVKRLDGPKLVEERWIACGMSSEVCLAELAAYERFESVMLVGHEPDFSRTLSALLGTRDAGSVNIRKASLTAIDMPALREGAGKLQFMIPSKLM